MPSASCFSCLPCPCSSRSSFTICPHTDLMNTSEIAPTLVTLLRELLEGAAKAGGYVLNGGDQGLLRSLDKLTASAASSASTGGASIAAHVDHLRFGLSLLNRWGEGDEDSFKGADWAASWRKTRVSDQEW